MALSNKEIKEEIENDFIIISPYKEENLNTSSYDVSLGNYYFRENKLTNSAYFNMYDKEQVEKLWGNPEKAIKAKDFSNTDLNGIKPNDEIIIISPGETILAHTEEFIGGKDHITTMMKARSSLGRNFILVCKCAGWGDVGYTNRWTMEITNASRFHTIPLVVGRRIAQIVFFKTGKILSEDYSHSGKYQSEANLNKLIKLWDPYTMIPKTYKDREIK